MAAITTAGSGNWSSTTPNAPWPSGTVPTSADTVTIANTHTVTLDTTGCIALSITMNTGSAMNCVNSANWDLTSQNDIVVSGNMTFDMSGTTTYTGTLNLNGTDSTGNGFHLYTLDGGSVTWKGTPRKRLTALNGALSAGATSAVVDDATGWKVGDIVVLGATEGYNNTTPRIDVVTLTSVSGSSIGWSGGTTYAHADNGAVGNFTSNLTVQPKTSGRPCAVLFYRSVNGAVTREVNNVAFANMGYSSQTARNATLSIYDNTNGLTGLSIPSLSHNAFYNCGGRPNLNFRLLDLEFEKDGNVFYSSGTQKVYQDASYANYNLGKTLSVGIFKGALGTSVTASAPGADDSQGRNVYDDIYVSSLGCGLIQNLSTKINSGKFDSNYFAIKSSSAFLEIENVVFNNNTYCFLWNKYSQVKATNCTFSGTTTLVEPTLWELAIEDSKIELINKNNDSTIQEIYYPIGEVKRDNSTIKRSTSSISIKPTRASRNIQREQEILCADGATIRVIGYVQADANFYNSGTWTAPTVTLSGLGEATQTFTATSACNGAWEQFDLSITNNSGHDGNFTLTYTANANAVTTGIVYFDGVPDAPFVTKCRHYGFTINESSPTRTVDPYAVANESTAAAYTGVTINNTTKEISFAAGTADTAQKFYDFHQATICDNLGYDVAISRAGTLYSLLSTWTVVDPYYSGTLTWSGGTIQYSTTGTKSDNLDGCIVEFGAAGGGTYTFDGTLSGTLDLRNLDAAAITVEVPTGTTTTTANNTGGAITVQTPQVYQSVVLTGGVAGSRVQLYDNTSSTELYNDVPGSWPFTWTDPDPYSADREIRLRVAYTDGADARQFIDQTIGTVTEADPELTYLVAQIDDAVYNANAIDGSALTGYAIVGSNLTIDVSDGTATWAEMYAYQVYWLSTEDGIRDQDLFIFGIDTANYLFYGGFKIKNTSAPSVPLLVTGGNGEPSSGPATDLLDTTGGTIFCNSAIVVPYSSGADVTEQIVRDGLTSQGYTTTRANAIDTIPEDVWGHTLP